MGEHLSNTLKNGVRVIKFNRPEKRNAITSKMYVTLRNLFEQDANNDEVVTTILTGSGDFYSSGNDFKDSMSNSHSGNSESSSPSANVRLLVDSMINYPKLLIAVVNGPAIGIAATTAALCDIIYATENAWFQTPFIQIGLCPEGCSSYTYPRILGRSKASEMLFLNRKLSAEEAYKCGFVSRVIPKESVNSFIDELREFGKLPLQSVITTKELIVGNVKNLLCECNKRESDKLDYMVTTEAFINGVITMMSKKNQKSKL